MRKLLMLALIALNAYAYADNSIQDITGSYFELYSVRPINTPYSQLFNGMTSANFTEISFMTLQTLDDCVKLTSSSDEYFTVDISQCPFRKLDGEFKNGRRFKILF